jgi:hypothetical protein
MDSYITESTTGSYGLLQFLEVYGFNKPCKCVQVGGYQFVVGRGIGVLVHTIKLYRSIRRSSTHS